MARPAAPVALFVVLTYAVMWVCFSAVIVTVPANTILGRVLLLMGAFAPAIVAVPLTAATDGRAAARTLAARALQWRGGVMAAVLAAGYVVAVRLAAAAVHRVALGHWPAFGTTPWPLLIAATLFSTPFQSGEEIGWRGYLLPRIADRFGYARGGLIVGVIWAAWHLPQFYIAGADSFHQSFIAFATGTVALSVAMTWLYVYADGALLPLMLMHSSVNNLKDILPSWLPREPGVFSLGASPFAWMVIGLMWVCAAIALAAMWRSHAVGSGQRAGVETPTC